MIRQHSPYCGCEECAPIRSSSRPTLITVAKADSELRTVAPILDAVAEEYKLTRADLLGRDRHRSVAEARSLAAWFAYKLTPLSYPEIGRAFGRDHATIMVAAKKIERRLSAGETLLRESAERVLAVLEPAERRTA